MHCVQPCHSVPDALALACLPEITAREHEWLPYYCERRNKTLHVACLRVPGQQLQGQILAAVNQQAQWGDGGAVHWEVLTDRAELINAINRAYEGSHDLESVSKTCSDLSSNKAVNLEVDTWPIARWFDALLNDAVHRRASDVHFLPGDKDVSIRFRIDGRMQNRTLLPIEVWRELLSRMKVLSSLDVTEHRRPQEGAFERCVHGKNQPVRSAFMPTECSEKVTLRLFRPVHALPNLNDIFVISEQHDAIKNALKKRCGLIVVAGATGSGKTTTLYGCLNHWLLQGLNLITLEDPVEVSIPGICQSEVNPSIGYSFSEGLRAALRHDPDGLLVGEIRDAETCQLALRSAITGHPVLASVHANDAVGVFQRLMGLGASLSDLQQCVHTVVVQRLARKPCHCDALTSRCVDCYGSGYFGCVATVELFRPNVEFFEDPSRWVTQQRQINLETKHTLQQLHIKKHLDHAEYQRLIDQVGGMDAPVSN